MIGQRIGNYRVVRQLGEGGMGVVYDAVREVIGGRAAIKVLRPQYAMNPEIAARFFNEARAANLIEHPGIVKVFDFGRLPTGATFLAMEYLQGESLFQRLRKRARLPEVDVLRLGRQIAAALAAAHGKHVIHRDLKPENIFLVDDAEAPGGERAKVLDFGIAKLSHEKHGGVHTQANMLMGTPLYMSPEQCRGSKSVGDRADVYALGVMLYEMLAGRPPFQAEEPGVYIGLHMFEAPPPLSRFAPTVTPALLRLVDSMLLKDPTTRPTMSAVATTLKDLANPPPATPRAQGAQGAQVAQVEDHTLRHVPPIPDDKPTAPSPIIKLPALKPPPLKLPPAPPAKETPPGQTGNEPTDQLQLAALDAIPTEHAAEDSTKLISGNLIPGGSQSAGNWQPVQIVQGAATPADASAGDPDSLLVDPLTTDRKKGLRPLHRASSPVMRLLRWTGVQRLAAQQRVALAVVGLALIIGLAIVLAIVRQSDVPDPTTPPPTLHN
jgi:serine/threonine protein kinase